MKMRRKEMGEKREWEKEEKRYSVCVFFRL
jgi:hypothetical protein